VPSPKLDPFAWTETADEILKDLAATAAELTTQHTSCQPVLVTFSSRTSSYAFKVAELL